MLTDEKKQLRKKYREIRCAWHPSVKAEMDTEICCRLASVDLFRNARLILFYYPLSSEINILPLAASALVAGKRIAFPKTEGNGRMSFFQVNDLQKDFSLGSFGIWEPIGGIPIGTKQKWSRSLLVVPGLAFDQKGFRLGYGGGYYDRFLEQFSLPTVGVVYSECLTESLPRGIYDRAVDVLVTEKEVRFVGKR